MGTFVVDATIARYDLIATERAVAAAATGAAAERVAKLQVRTECDITYLKFEKDGTIRSKKLMQLGATCISRFSPFVLF